MNFIKLPLGLAVAAAAATALSSPALSQDSWSMGDPYEFSVAASQPQHSIYAVSVAHKTIIEEALPGVELNIMATQGGNENIELIAIGEANMANGNSIAAVAAERETGKYAGMGTSGKVLSLFPAYTAELGAIVPADSDVMTFRDLLGKAIATGPVGSGAESVVTRAIAAMELTDDDFARVQRAAPQQGFASLAAGQVDAVVWGTAHPSGLVLENQSTQNLRFVPFEQDDLVAISAAIPGFVPGQLRPGTYKNQDDGIAWIAGSTNSWVAADVPEALVYEIAKALWENREKLAKAHSSQQFLSEDMVRAQATLVPFHPGARRYFVEQGILSE